MNVDVCWPRAPEQRDVRRFCLFDDAERNESPPLEEVMRILHGWKDLPKENLLKAFEAGHFAGVEEMKRNGRLFERVAPMGVNDIMMAVQYRWCGRAMGSVC
jgi:hypothetical protein